MSENFPIEYLGALPENSVLAISEITSNVIDYWDSLPSEMEDQQIDYFLEAFSIVKALASNLDYINIDEPLISGDSSDIVILIMAYIRAMSVESKESEILVKISQYDNDHINLKKIYFLMSLQKET